MATFLNSAQFAAPQSYSLACGSDLRPDRTIVGPNGAVIGYVQSGGVLNPSRYELHEGAILFRFDASNVAPVGAAKGKWWIERSQFEKLLGFANHHGLAIGLAARVLCLVPPEWNDMGTLIRVRVVRPLLAYRGLGNSVVVPKSDGLGPVRLPHQNELAARRVFQLFIPGLADLSSVALRIERDWHMDPNAANQGWLYIR